LLHAITKIDPLIIYHYLNSNPINGIFIISKNYYTGTDKTHLEKIATDLSAAVANLMMRREGKTHGGKTHGKKTRGKKTRGKKTRGKKTRRGKTRRNKKVVM